MDRCLNCKLDVPKNYNVFLLLVMMWTLAVWVFERIFHFTEVAEFIDVKIFIMFLINSQKWIGFMYKFLFIPGIGGIPPFVYICFSIYQIYFLTESFLVNISMYLLFIYFLLFSYILILGFICSSFPIVKAVSMVLWFRIFSRAGKEGVSHSCEHPLCCTPPT